MKKILIATNVFTLIAVYFFACTPTMQLATSVDGSYKLDNAPNYYSCYNCLTDDIHGETAQEFADVTARYRTTHFNIYNALAKNQLSASGINPNYNKLPTFQDSRSCWFSVDTLKKFICLMEKYAAAIRVPSSNLGVRFYYANYDNVKVYNQNFANHHTLYLVPTAYSAKAGTFIDFEPRESAKTGSIVPISNFINDSLPTFTTNYLFMISAGPSVLRVMQANGTTTNVSTNQGDLCPPSTGCNPTINAVDQTYSSAHY